MLTTDFNHEVIKGYLKELKNYRLKKDYIETDKIRKELREHNIEIKYDKNMIVVEFYYWKWLGHYHGIAFEVLYELSV